MNEASHAALLRSIGEASFRRDAWDDVLELLTRAAGARGAAIIPLRGGTPGLRHTASLEALADAYVSTGWATRDYRYRAIPKMMAGGVAVDADFIAYDDLRREPYYESFLRPLGFRHFAGLGVRHAEDAWAVTLQRGADDEPFSAEEQARLAALIEPLRAAVTVGRALGDAYHQGSLDRLDASSTACLLLDRLGLVAHMNRTAEAMLGTTLVVTRGLLALSTRELTSRLQAQVRQALSPLAAVTTRTLPLVERDGNGVRVFEVLRLPESDVDAFGRYRCMILVHRAGDPGLVDVEVFRALFALSRQEAVLAQALSQSLGLPGAARLLGISHETARSQLKSIFDKTGTRSQAALLTLIGSLALVGR